MTDLVTSSDFTVLMAVYIKDDHVLFEKALASVFSNSVIPTKTLIIADGPLTNELETVISSHSSNSNFSIIRLEKNLGLASALNTGLKLITTKFIIRADSDDYNHSQRFYKIIAKLNEGFDLVGSSILEVDKTGNKLAIRKPPLSQDEIQKFVKRRCPFNHMSVGFRTETIRQANGYPLIHLKEDYALWATLISNKARVCNLAEVLVDATTGADMYRRRGGWKYAFAEIQMQKHLLRFNIKTPRQAVIDGLLRAAVFLAPSLLREFIYIKLLRKKVS